MAHSALLRLAAAICLAAAALAEPAAAVPSFSGLGFLSSGSIASSIATAVSADGSVVVGMGLGTVVGTSNPYRQAFRWTAGGGMVGLGYVPGETASVALGVSADGSVVVGGPNFPNAIYDYRIGGSQAFRWTADGGMVGLGSPPGGSGSIATAVSADGSVVVGLYSTPFFFSSDLHAFRWTAGGGMVGLGGLFATDVSADGSVVVGGTGPEAFRWTARGGMVGLGILSGPRFSDALGVSADGSVVVGDSYSASSTEAFRWTAGGGMVGLGYVPGETDSFAFDVSADGSVVVGDSYSASSSEAFIWDPSSGMRSVKDMLTDDYGLALAGWTLSSARAISADGSTIVGVGINPSGDTEAWVATIPEPSTGLLVLSALIGFAARRRWCA